MHSDGYRYSFFDTTESREKLPLYTGYVSCSYWTRTPDGNNACRINANAKADSQTPGKPLGIAPAFCL